MNVAKAHHPQVSAVIPSYDSAEFFPDAIEFALSQDIAPEVVVVVTARRIIRQTQLDGTLKEERLDMFGSRTGVQPPHEIPARELRRQTTLQSWTQTMLSLPTLK